jgi:proteasome lid subunit RPN8/RPN11
MITGVAIPKDIFDVILDHARTLHPRETILLLRGKVKKNIVDVSDVLIPPLATHGRGFSGFPTHMLPMDFSIVGTAHSHPSGIAMPSVEDLNHSFGRVILVVGSPYLNEENAAAYDHDGRRLTLQVT